MPQFDTTFLVGQIFWLIISFGGLYLGVQFIVFPLYRRIFTERDKQIQEILTQAEQLTQKTEQLEEQFKKRNEAFEQRRTMRLNQAHQESFKQMQKTLEQTDQSLLRSFKKTVQKMELEENHILQKTPDFITRAIRGVK